MDSSSAKELLILACSRMVGTMTLSSYWKSGEIQPQLSTPGRVYATFTCTLDISSSETMLTEAATVWKYYYFCNRVSCRLT